MPPSTSLPRAQATRWVRRAANRTPVTVDDRPGVLIGYRHGIAVVVIAGRHHSVPVERVTVGAPR